MKLHNLYRGLRLSLKKTNVCKTNVTSEQLDTSHIICIEYIFQSKQAGLQFQMIIYSIVIIIQNITLMN